MAERRMFAKTIIDSDAFLDMPLSTQSLYFHLSMRADDDGFINNPKKIQRMVGCGEDDLKLLIAKSFIIPFDSGIVVIKHWKIHNYIRTDRYKPTVYSDEMSRLSLKENGSYTVGIPDGIPDDNQLVYQMETQDRLGKVRLGQDSLGYTSVPDEPEPENEPIVITQPTKETVPYQAVVDLYHSICTSYPKIRTLSDARKKAVKARLKTYTLDDFKEMFTKAEASDFLKGKNGNNWSANFDWLVKDANMAKVLDGNYDNKKPQGGRTEMVPDWMNESKRLDQARKFCNSLKDNPDLSDRVEKLKQQIGGD